MADGRTPSGVQPSARIWRPACSWTALGPTYAPTHGPSQAIEIIRLSSDTVSDRGHVHHLRVAMSPMGILDSLSEFGVATHEGGEERGGFTGIFEIVAAGKARVGRVKRRPFCEPYLTLGTLAALIYLATPPGPRGRTGQRAMVNHVFVTDRARRSSCRLKAVR